MAEEYEVPSPHEHAVEEATESARDSLTQKIALMTAVLATVGALVSYQSGSSETEAMFKKNESILKQAEASDKWAFYQSKSVKGHIAEGVVALTTDPAVKARFEEQKAKNDKEKEEIKKEATELQAKARELSEESEKKLRPHERLALAMSFIQIAVALAAIAVLTRKKWLLWNSVVCAGIGIVMAASSFFSH